MTSNKQDEKVHNVTCILEESTRMYRQETTGRMAPNHGRYDSTTASFDEFAHPELKEYRKPSTLTQKFSRLFTDMPVFPIGMAAFCGMAGYGIWKYQKMPIKDSVSKTLYFTSLRLAAQSLAVGIIVAGAAHHVYKDYTWNKEHPGEERPRGL